jgi:hemolysin activation/secretion protein
MEREIPLVHSGAQRTLARRNAPTRAPGYSQRVAHRLRRGSVCLLAAFLAGPGTLHAQQRPDAGHVLENAPATPRPPVQDPAAALPPQDQRPALDLPDSKSFTVRHWKITGAHAFPAATLEKLVNDYRGQKLTLKEINAVAGRITEFYRWHGYQLSRAYIPAQTIHNDTVEIAIIEGHLAAIEVTNDSPVAGFLITRYLERLRSPNPIDGPALERSLLLLSDLPGVEVHSTLKPGASVGASDLDVSVSRASRFSASADADSFGNRYTGQFRGGGTFNLNDPFWLGDLFTLRVDSAGPGMTYGRAAWQVPVGGSGLKAGIADSYVRYRLGKAFETLGAHGTAQVATLWTAYPLLRSQYHNLSLQLSYDRKSLDDRVDVIRSETRRTLGVWTLGASGDWIDRVGGYSNNSYSFGILSGQLNLDPAATLADQGPNGHHTAGRYSKLTFSYARTQFLGSDLMLYTALNGQFATKNLDSSETQSLGGAYGVRAYPQDEGVGDDAAVLNVELRWTPPDLAQLQVITFVDAGTVRVNHSPAPGETNNRRTLKGEGLGFQWVPSRRFAVKLYLALRAGPPPVSDIDRRPRAWLQYAQYF